MAKRHFKPGDLVIYRKSKRSACPGPRARCVEPSAHGDSYSYQVDKFWVVCAPDSTDRVMLQTRRGKRHLVSTGDRNLRHAQWWERLLFRRRFPELRALG